jgi:hypothetical protein
MDEYALDFLDPQAKRLVKEMLAAIVNYPDVHPNGFSVQRTRSGGYHYSLARRGGGPSPFQDPQVLPTNIVEVLILHGVARPKIDPQWPERFRSFTEDALDWQRKYGGPSPDDIRKLIGRTLRRQPRGATTFFDTQAVATEFNIAEEQIQEQTELLLATGLVESLHRGDTGFGILALTVPEGVLWAEKGFPSIHSLSSTNINVTVEVAVNNIIQQARAAEIPEATLMEFEARLRRVKEELDKPKGQGKFQRVGELMAFGANSKEVGLLVAQFIASQSDRIQHLVDIAGTVLPG